MIEKERSGISPEEDLRLADLYRKFLENSGLQVTDDRRLFKDALPAYVVGLDLDELYNSQFMGGLDLIYEETMPFEILWQVLSWQPLGGPLMLKRKDSGSLLERYRER